MDISFFDDAKHSVSRYYLKTIYPKLLALVSFGSVFETITEQGLHSVVEKTLPKRTAFTLAEVLIVLGIIGLIADMTIPTLVNGYQKKVTATKLQKAYSEISQALKLAEVDNGPMQNWSFPNISHANNTAVFGEEYFYKYFKIIEKCEPTSKKCWIPVHSLSGETGAWGVDSPAHFSFLTSNGYSVNFWANNPADPFHVQVWVDIDGPLKGQSIFGKDVFGMFVSFTGGKIIFSASSIANREDLKNNTSKGCNKGITGVYSGYNCGALIQYDGWKISDDYPW